MIALYHILRGFLAIHPRLKPFASSQPFVNQVLTPVRRSARKAPASASVLRNQGARSEIQMLEATNFCYEGNPVLTPAARDGTSKPWK